LQVISDTCEFELAARIWRNGPADSRALGPPSNTRHNEIARAGKVIPSAFAPDGADSDGHWAEPVNKQQHFIVKLRFQIASFPPPSGILITSPEWNVSSDQNNRFAVLIAINLSKREPQLHQDILIERSSVFFLIHSDAGDRPLPVEGKLSRKWCFNVHQASRSSQFSANQCPLVAETGVHANVRSGQ
jgi:hypothetical protein